MNERLNRIKLKIASQNISLNPPVTVDEVEGFERQRNITLPEGYRRFVLEVGNGGDGPPFFGLVALGQPDTYGSSLREDNEFWFQLPHIARVFPFTRSCVFRGDDAPMEGTEEETWYGNIYLGTDGCRMDWHLVITGPARGSVCQMADGGLLIPNREFLQWYEEWLDGITEWIPES